MIWCNLKQNMLTIEFRLELIYSSQCSKVKVLASCLILYVVFNVTPDGATTVTFNKSH